MKRLLLLLLLTACAVTGNVVKEFSQETEVYFCPRDNCRYIFADNLLNATNIDCAVYDTNIPEVLEILKIKNARLVVDDQTSNITQLTKMGAIIDSKYSQMHNKFCILDNQTLITGSMNPTIRDSTLNNNNLIIIHSKNIVKPYEDEFNELYSGTFSGGIKTKSSLFYINDEKYEIYFCPEDWCANKVLYALDSAKESIYFMTFSFTHSKIADLLIKKKEQGVIVKGIFEKTQNSQYSAFDKLNESGIEVKYDNNKGNMHHKVFIIDRKIVVTGSMNPSINGDTKNDENLLIIENPRISSLFLDEIEAIFPRD